MMYRLKSLFRHPYAEPFLAVVALMGAGTFNSILPGPLGALVVVIVLLKVGYNVLRWSVGAVIALVHQSSNMAITKALSVLVVLSLFLPAIRSAHYIHLFLFYPYYAYVIRANRDVPPRRMKFEWGDAALFVTDGYQGITLLYDESDMIDAYVDSLGGRASAVHLIGHFYVIYDN